MINAQRGDVPFSLDGEVRPLRLTLGGLAELETALGVDGLAGLAERLQRGRLSSAEALEVLAAGFRGGGTAMTAARLGTLVPASAVGEAAAAAARLLAVSLVIPLGGGPPSHPPPPQTA